MASSVSLHGSFAGEDALKKGTAKRVARVSANHPMVGVWEQEPDKGARTTVVYTVSVKQGKFAVSGKDGDSGTVMKISKVSWNGSSLSFTSFYRRNRHTANVVFKIQGKRKLGCEV